MNRSFLVLCSAISLRVNSLPSDMMGAVGSGGRRRERISRVNLLQRETKKRGTSRGGNGDFSEQRETIDKAVNRGARRVPGETSVRKGLTVETTREEKEKYVQRAIGVRRRGTTVRPDVSRDSVGQGGLSAVWADAADRVSPSPDAACCSRSTGVEISGCGLGH